MKQMKAWYTSYDVHEHKLQPPHPPFAFLLSYFSLQTKKLVLPTHHHSLGNDVMLMLVKINEYGNFHIIDYLIMVTMKNLIIALCVCGALANKFIDQTVDCKSHLNRH